VARRRRHLDPVLVPLGRAAFAAGFLWAPLDKFSQQTIALTAQQGVPLPGLLGSVAGLLSLAGGLSVLLGYRARLCAWLLVLFLVPVTIWIHNFWAAT
jgi:putative oxidoreductase